MKYFLLYVVFLTSSFAWSFEYKIDQASLIQPSFLQLHEIGKRFSAQGFHSISDLNLTSAGFYFDRAYVSHKWGSGLVIKSGLRVPTEIRGKVIEDAELGIQVLHFELDQTPYMVLGMDMTSAEFNEAVKPWITQKGTVRNWIWLLPRAHAVGVCTDSRKSKLQESADDLEEDSIMRTIGKCATDVLSGAIGSVESTLSFFKRLATEPRQLWQETKESFKELKAFVKNIRGEFKSALEAFHGMSSDEKLEMACIIAGEALGTAAQALTGAGAATALSKALPSLLLKIKSAAKMLQRFAELRARGVKVPGGAFLAREAMSCAI